MNSQLLLCLACCLFVTFPAEGLYTRSALNRLFADLLRDDSEKLPCMEWVDQQPDICKDMLRRDPGYCLDYGELPFCRRTCSRCGPKKSKPPAPAGDCDNKSDICPYLMHLHNYDNCKLQPVYAFKYCRKYCNICQEPLGSVWKP